MTSTIDTQIDLDTLLKRLHLANARRVWRDLVQRAEKEQWSHGQLLQILFEEEVAHRRGTRLTRAVRAAAFPFLRTVEEFDFTYQSTLRLTTIGSLLAPDFVTEGRSAILLGKPGRGKTHLAIAIAYRAIQNGFDALFTTAAELIDHLSAASRDGKMRETLAHYVRPHVLVVDEVGYLAYGDDAANVLYHVVNDRHIRRRAMIFTTNKNPKRWGQALHDDDLGEAIVDRILERGRLLRLDGPSIRTKHLPDDELVGVDQHDPGDRRFSGIDAAEFPERTDVLLPYFARLHLLGSSALRGEVGPPKFLGDQPLATHAPVFAPGGTYPSRPPGLRPYVLLSRCCLPGWWSRRLPRLTNFGVHFRSLRAHCLRFATPITRTPRKTRFRLAALPWPGGSPTRWVTSSGFRSCWLYMTSS